MLEALAWVGSVSGYLAVAGTVYRKQYIRTFKEWRRWQAADPNKNEELWDDYHTFRRPRVKISYHDYMSNKSFRIHPGWLGSLWLPIGLFLGVRKVLQPEVKVPDYARIEELDRLSKEMPDG